MFNRVLLLEAKKLVIKRIIVLLAVVFGVLAFSCWNGINDYKLILANQKPFQEVEKDKVKMHLHYTFYGIRGVRLLFIPTPLSVMFNDVAVFRGMTAHVDTAEKLDITNSFKGKDLFADKSGYMDFSGIMLIIGACLALAYGYEIPLHRDHLKLLADAYGSPAPVYFMVIARILLINLVFWMLSVLALLWLLLNGVNALRLDFLLYLLGLTLVLTTFVLIGANVGTLKSRSFQVIILMAVYFSLVFFIPGMIHQVIYIEAKKGIQSIYDYEYETFKYIMAFEKRFYERFGTWQSKAKIAPKDMQDMVRSRWDREYKQLRGIESERIKRIRDRVETYQTLSAFLPTSFYFSINKELSSKGFQNFIDFYEYAYDMKHEFMKFYVERKFYRAMKKGEKVEPFIKGNEDLFYAKSQLPASFAFGLAVSLIWIGGLALLFGFRFHRLFVSQPKIPEEKYRLDLKKNKVRMVVTTHPVSKSKVISGVRRFHSRTLRVPGWDSLPEDIKVENYFALFNVPLPESLQPVAGLYCDSELLPDQRAMVITEIIRNLDADVFIFNEFMAGLSDQYTAYFAELLKTLKQGRAIVYFTGKVDVSERIGDKATSYPYDFRLYK